VRKFWYAGAVVAGGIFLFGVAAPAQADLLPGTGTADQQADEQLANLLGASNGATVENPLRYSTLGNTPLGAPPLVDFKSGNNSADTTNLNRILPGESAQEPRPDLPAADVVGGAVRRPSNALQMNNIRGPRLPFDSSPLSGLLGGLPLFGGLLPDGGTPGMMRPTASANQAEAFNGGVPLLGGLGGVLPVNALPKSKKLTDVPDTSGLPAGGMAIIPAATATASTARPGVPQIPATGRPTPAPSSGATQPAPADDATDAGQPAKNEAPKDQAKPAATPDDPRLHEEPVDGEARRVFSSDGRPVAGVDQQYR
jgi:hypothetical protein